MQNVYRSNDSHRYILTCIDVFSKRVFAVPLKDKRGPTLAVAFEKMFSDTVPNLVQSVSGTEFLNSHVQKVFMKNNSRHFWSLNDDIKAACVERFNRSLKTRMYSYFTAHHTSRWIDVLQSLINSYNNNFHRTIGMSPNEVTADNSQQVAERMYPLTEIPKWKFQLIDTVRITKYKHVFVKGYIQNWTEEVFTISGRYASSPVNYGLKDLTGEEIKGRFYDEEFQKVVKT
jgi:hypothetical protein